MPDLFRKVVDRIMRGRPEGVPQPERPSGRPESFGWLRRPEHDTEAGDAWELPSGEIRLLRPDRPARRASPVPAGRARPTDGA